MGGNFLERFESWVFFSAVVLYFLAGVVGFCHLVVADSLPERLTATALGVGCWVAMVVSAWGGDLLRYPVMWYVLKKVSSSPVMGREVGRDFMRISFSDRLRLVIVRGRGVVAFCQWRRWTVDFLLPREKWLRLLELPQFRLLQLAHPWVRGCYDQGRRYAG